jgi:hypothetical protein
VLPSSGAFSAAAVFFRTLLVSRTAISEPLGSGVSLNVILISDGDFVSRASDAGLDFT